MNGTDSCDRDVTPRKRRRRDLTALKPKGGQINEDMPAS